MVFRKTFNEKENTYISNHNQKKVKRGAA